MPSAKIKLLSITVSSTLPGQFFQVNIFPWRIFSNKFIFSNKNLCYIIWFLLEQCFQSASFRMIVILSGSLASKCLLLHFKLICDSEVYWIVKKAIEMTFAVFCDFITCRKTCSVTSKSEGKVLSSRKLYLSLSVHQDSLFLNNLVDFLWFYKIVDKSIKPHNDLCNVLYQNACEKEELIFGQSLVIPSRCWVQYVSSLQVQVWFCGITCHRLCRPDA